MNKILKLLYFEFSIQNKIHHLIKALVIFFLFAIVAVALLNEQHNIQKFGIIFALLYYPLSLIGFINVILKPDLDDGYLELLLVNFNPLQIVLAKFSAFITSGIISLIINLPIIIILFSLQNLAIIINLATCLFLLLLLAGSLLILLSTLQCYFRSGNNFLSFIILPLLMPAIIMTGLVMQQEMTSQLIYILLGINLILIPIAIILSSYLLKNIYNI